jgi:exonuclease I
MIKKYQIRVKRQVPKRHAHMSQLLDIVQATAVQRMRYTRNLSKNNIQQQPGQTLFSLNRCPVLPAACILSGKQDDRLMELSWLVFINYYVRIK